MEVNINLKINQVEKLNLECFFEKLFLFDILNIKTSTILKFNKSTYVSIIVEKKGD